MLIAVRHDQYATIVLFWQAIEIMLFARKCRKAPEREASLYILVSY